jgi:isoamylase
MMPTPPPFWGARYDAGRTGIGFRVRSLHAARIELSLYPSPTGAAAALRRIMSLEGGGAFFAHVTSAELGASGIGDGVYYGYRAWGPNWTFDPAWSPGSGAGFVADVDEDGNRFNPNKLLLDPYALEISHNPLVPGQPSQAPYQSGVVARLVDTAPFAPKGIVIDVPSPDWSAKPGRPFKDEIIYEVHLRGFTKNDSAMPEPLRGTYGGAALRAGYLAQLGVTAIEFQPVHETQCALNDVAAAGQQNYWGYDSISFFAPNRRYARDQSPGGPTREWIAMVKAFHAAGLKVYVDVVFNHHNEGKVDTGTGTIGMVYSLRGLDNQSYYECIAGSATHQYQDDNGVGPNLNAAAPLCRDLMMGSLQYWTGVLGADGFRFDLAAILGNANSSGGYAFDGTDPDNVLNRAVRELPSRAATGGAGVDLIAEPYTADEAGQEQGKFPAGWSEWNDRYRDAIRGSQNKLGYLPVTPGMLATRFAGSADLFGANGRQPANSVNYVTVHDGMTLRDLHSFSDVRNSQPFPKGPSPGGRSAAEEMCWDHGGDPVAQRQAVRTSLALLFLSAGTPLLSGGGEIYRTQFGNNNAFNLDTSTNWIDWTAQPAETSLTNYVRGLLSIRKAHGCFRPARFFDGADHNGNGVKDLTWYRDNGVEADQEYFQNPQNHFLAYRLDASEFGEAHGTVYVACNGWIDTVMATLPTPLTGQWFVVADSCAAAEAWGNVHQDGVGTVVTGSYPVAGRSVALLVEHS